MQHLQTVSGLCYIYFDQGILASREVRCFSSSSLDDEVLSIPANDV